MRYLSVYSQFLCLAGILFFSIIEATHAAKFMGRNGETGSHQAACQSVGQYQYGSVPSIQTGAINHERRSAQCYAKYPHKVCCIWDPDYGDSGAYVGSDTIPFSVTYIPDPNCPAGQVYSASANGCIPEPPNSNRGGNGSCNSGNPVNIATGRKFLNANDFTDNNYPLININRTYDSEDGTWVFSFGARLFNLHGKKHIAGKNGATTTFVLADGGWIPELSGGKSLKVIGDEWEYRTKSETYIFDTTGRILQVENTKGQKITFNYVEDAYQVDVVYPGGTLSVFYDVRLSWIQKVILPNEEVIQYHYADEDPKRLVKVDYAGHITEYRYEHPSLPNALTSIIDAEGNVYKTIEYYDDGRVKTSSLAINIASDHFSYPSEDITIVTNSLGKQTTYHIADYFGSKKIVQVEGHASQNCMAANKDYEYFPNGLLKSKTDWKGVKTTFEYNSRGLRTLQTEAEGTAQQRQIRTQWHSEFSQPVKIIEPDREIHFEYDATGKLIKRTVKPLQG